jgi:hypothetical protein
LPEQFPIFVIPAVLIVGLMLIMVTLPVRIRIERGMGEVYRVYSLRVWICECRSSMCRISSA